MGRILYKSFIEEHKDVENIVTYGKRALYVKRVKVDLFGHVGYAYVACDIRRKGDKIPINEIIPLCYTRQSVENLFGLSKRFLDILLICTHSIETVR